MGDVITMVICRQQDTWDRTNILKEPKNQADLVPVHSLPPCPSALAERSPQMPGWLLPVCAKGAARIVSILQMRTWSHSW